MVWAVQASIFAVSGLAAFLLHFDFAIPPRLVRELLYALPLWIVVKSIVFHFANLDRSGLRYVSIADVYRLALANLAGSILGCVAIIGMEPGGIPRSVCLIDLMLSFLGTAGLRVPVRMAAESKQVGRSSGPDKRALIYGTGDAGVTLLREIRSNPKLKYHVCGFVDDELEKQGVRINGVRVAGTSKQVEAIVKVSEWRSY